MDNEIKIARSGFEDEIGRKLSDDEWSAVVEAISEAVMSLADDFILNDPQ